MYLREIGATVIRSDRKSLSVQIRDGAVTVRAPLYMSDSEINRLTLTKRSWIEKQLSAESQRLKEGQTQPFTESEIRALAEKAKVIIPERVSLYAPKIGVTFNRITIRCQRTRWGSCSSAGNLNFNCLLALFPVEIIDSVVVHELCHRKHMNHSPQFYAEIDRVFPDYKRCHKWLNEKGREYMARLR